MPIKVNSSTVQRSSRLLQGCQSIAPRTSDSKPCQIGLGEIRQFLIQLEAMKSFPPFISMAIRAMTLMGLRHGEVLNLRWAWFDSKELAFEVPKLLSSEHPQVFLPPSLAKRFLYHRETQNHLGMLATLADSDQVFPLTNEQSHCVRRLRSAIHLTMTSAFPVSPRNVQPREMFRSLITHAGIDDEIASKLLREQGSWRELKPSSQMRRRIKEAVTELEQLVQPGT